MDPKEQALCLAKALDEKKAGEVTVLATGEVSSLAEYFVIASATSNAQIKALTEACEKAMDLQGEEVHHVEGHRGGVWVLMDYSSVVVHIFMEEARGFYDLERLWADAVEVDISHILVP